MLFSPPIIRKKVKERNRKTKTHTHRCTVMHVCIHFQLKVSFELVIS